MWQCDMHQVAGEVICVPQKIFAHHCYMQHDLK